jgi:hypothetical protein
VESEINAEVWAMGEMSKEGSQHKQRAWDHFCTVIILLAEYCAVRYSIVWLAWCASLFLWFAVRNYCRHYLGRFARIGIVASIPIIFAGTYYLTKEHSGSVQAQTQTSQPSSSTVVQGNNNNTGNITQSGNGNNAVIGNGNRIGNTYVRDGRIGWLRPALNPPPSIGCVTEQLKKNRNAIILILGTDVVGSTVWPFTLFTMSGRPILTLDKNLNGEIAVTTDVYDKNNDVVVSITKNKYTISDDAFEVEHPNSSTLQVWIKHEKEKVLDVQFVNKRVVKVLGHFYWGGRDLIATDTDVVFHTPQTVDGHLGANCIEVDSKQVTGFEF